MSTLEQTSPLHAAGIFIKPISSASFDLPQYSKIGVLVDENSRQHCYPLISEALPEHILINVSSGEQQKNIQTCQLIWEALTEHQFDRKSLLINLGGGVIGDMGGFCAATYKRGIDFMQVPTTLLAQVDASVGGKLGIDFHGYKNQVGVFKNPKQVLIDTQFLDTLPERELRSGFAEIIKHCLIADREAWQQLRLKSLYDQDWDAVIEHSVRIKLRIATEDPTEKGLRKVLNFGHTVGHAIESFFLEDGDIEQQLLHGEAIAIGIICESYLAHQRDMLTQRELREIQQYIWSIFPRVRIFKEHISGIAAYVWQDKKNEGKNILCSMINGIGNAVYDVEITPEEVEESLLYYGT